MNRERDRGQDKEDNNEEEYDGIQGCDQERDRELNRNRDRELQRAIGYQKNGDKDKDQTLKKLNGTDFSDRDGRELSSESCDDDLDEVENQLGISNQQLEELQKQISQMEELAKEKRQLVITFQEKAQKLEVALTAAKKLSSHRQMQLTKLHRCFLHVKDYNERLKSSEQELQSLVGETMTEDDTRNNVGGRDLTNGNT